MQDDRKKRREWGSWGGGDVPCIFRCEWTTTKATYNIGKSTLCNFCIIDVNDVYNRCHVILILMLRYHMLDSNLNVKMKANRKLTNIRIELSPSLYFENVLTCGLCHVDYTHTRRPPPIHSSPHVFL